MARVRVTWQEVTTYDQVLVIDDFDPKDTEAIENAICEQANFLHVDEVSEREIIDTRVIPEKEVSDGT